MRTKIIADIGSNHMGDMELARKMIKSAAEAGVGTVKFQSWQARKLRKDFPDYESHYRRHMKTELSDDNHRQLIQWCKEFKVEFLTTCFDLDRVEFLASLGLKTIKVASSDCTSFTLLKKLMEHFEHLIVSIGMSTDEEVKQMIHFLRNHKVTVLHCVSIYPTPLGLVNLERMNWIRSLGVLAGFSDHSLGTEAGKLAISMGAEILEKHLTLDRNLPGKDQPMSTLPEEFKELVEFAKLAEKLKGTAHPELSSIQKEMREVYIGKWGGNR